MKLSWRFDINRQRNLKSRRCPLGCLEVGDRFRFMNRYGKPTGKRYTVTVMPTELDRSLTRYSRYVLIGDGVEIIDDDGIKYGVNGGYRVRVKPINFDGLVVEAKLAQYIE